MVKSLKLFPSFLKKVRSTKYIFQLSEEEMMIGRCPNIRKINETFKIKL